jgi:hypothetical protein
VSQQELLSRVLGVLNAERIPFMLTGSLVSSIQGEPRSTHDIDVVVELRPETARRLLAAFPSPAYYLDERSVMDAVAAGDQFSLLAVDEGDKVDFWLLTGDAFDRSRFSRRQRVEVLGTVAWVSSPEDTILMKLKWAKLSGGSEKQLADAIYVYEVQAARLDAAHLESWVTTLGLEEQWSALKARARPVSP